MSQLSQLIIFGNENVLKIFNIVVSPKNEKATMEEPCSCDKSAICSILGECFRQMAEVQALPKFLTRQINKAVTPEQALTLLKIFKQHYAPREKTCDKKLQSQL